MPHKMTAHAPEGYIFAAELRPPRQCWHPEVREDQFYSSRRWRRLRAWYLARHALCADPYGVHARTGIPGPANEIDHVEPRKLRPDLEWDVANLRPMCKSCHSRRSQEEGGHG